MRRFALLVIIHTIACGGLFAQTPNIDNYLSMIERGQAEHVKTELPSLLNRYPNNPGVLYLQAALTTDGAEAVRMYQNIVDNYPKNEWADDALFKVCKFYEAIGLDRTAELKLNQLKTNYPDSRYVADSTPIEATQVTERKVEAPQPEATLPQPRTIEEPAARKGEETPNPSATTPSDVVKQEQPPAMPPRIEPVTRETARTETDSRKFALQVGVFSTRANANKQKMFFEYQQYSAEIVSKVRDSKELFAVLVSGFATADEAKTQGDEIKRSFNIDYIVVTR